MYDVVKEKSETDKQVYVTQLSVGRYESDAHTIQDIENIVHVIHDCIKKS